MTKAFVDVVSQRQKGLVHPSGAQHQHQLPPLYKLALEPTSKPTDMPTEAPTCGHAVVPAGASLQRRRTLRRYD
jgi:hypothetical protein